MSGKFKGPGPKVFIVLTITIFVIVSAISINAYKNKNPKKVEVVVENRQASVVKVNNNLRGNYTNLNDDGMLSWEKVLNSTTPRNQLPAEIDFDFEIETDPNSFTSGVGIEAMQEILMALSNPNADFDVDALMEKIGKSSEEELSYTKKYHTNQAFVVGSSDETIRKYINDLSFIYREEFMKQIPDLDSFVGIQTEKEFVTKLSQINKNIATRLSAISVPEIFTNAHTEYLNNLDATAFYASIVLNEKNDPLLAYMTISKLNNSIDNVEKLFTQIMNFPINNGIIFSEGEPAYDFYNLAEEWNI